MGVLEPLNLTWRVDSVASAIIGILVHDENHFAMIGMEEGDLLIFLLLIREIGFVSLFFAKGHDMDLRGFGNLVNYLINYAKNLSISSKILLLATDDNV